MNWGFPFETITSAPVRDAYMSDVLRFFNLIPPPVLSIVHISAGAVFFTWNSSSGLKYRVQYKKQLTDPNWTQLGSDITATNTLTSATDNSPGSAQRFYRVLLLN